MASGKIIRAASLYLDGTKFAEVTSCGSKINAGNESMIADGGWQGESDGAITIEITPKTIIPVAGQTVDPVTLMLSRKYVQVSYLLGGKIHSATCKVNATSAEWDHKSGMVTGDMTLRGGEPTQVG